MPVRPLRRLTRAGLAALTAVALAAAPALVHAEDSDDPRAERDDVRQQAADVAAQLDALEADAAEVSAALDALAQNVQSKRAQYQDAGRAARAADQEVVVARAEEQRLEQEIAQLEQEVADVAVSSYINPPDANLASVYEVEDLNDAALAEALLGTQNSQQRDVIDRLSAAEDDLSAQRVAAENAAQEAEALRMQVQDQYQELRSAQEQQQELARQVDERINRAAGEAAALAERDAELSEQIAEEAAQFAQYLQGVNLGPVGTPQNVGPVSVADAGNGIVVNVSIVDQVRAMIVAAANSGVTLTGGGYRDPQQQIELRKAHCGTSYYAIYQMPSSSCSPPTAIPGTSNHEQGLAIDFDNASYGGAVHSWLSGNAANYGLYNLPSESWHWSVDGG